MVNERSQEAERELVLDIMTWAGSHTGFPGNGKYYWDDLLNIWLNSSWVLNGKMVLILTILAYGIESPYDINYIKQLRKVFDKYDIKNANICCG